jgi:hypothetical protein
MGGLSAADADVEFVIGRRAPPARAAGGTPIRPDHDDRSGQRRADRADSIA